MMAYRVTFLFKLRLYNKEAEVIKRSLQPSCYYTFTAPTNTFGPSGVTSVDRGSNVTAITE